MFVPIRQHKNGTVMRHVADGDAKPFPKCDPGETRSRLLDASGTPRACGHP
jgi:hypothetical protein